MNSKPDNRAKQLFRTFRAPAIVVGITLIVAVGSMAVYALGELTGDANKFYLPSQMFGVPSALRAHGIDELYLPEEAGWDGQFYYYIANDPFAVRDTPEHLDQPAYRYQRIGIPLLAKAWATLSGKSWVSPKRFYLTALLLVLTASGVLAHFFQHRGRSPYLALLWSLGLGTQVTVLNGLPDGAADALVILALIGLFSDRPVVYVAAMMFAVLSREAYAVIPFAIGIVAIVRWLFPRQRRARFDRATMRTLACELCVHAIPLVVFAAWQVYVRVHLRAAPSSQAGGILGAPLASAIDHVRQGLSGHHHLVGSGEWAYYEAIGVMLFVALLGMAVFAIARWIRCARSDDFPDDLRTRTFGVCVAFGALTALYCCFGVTVMMHHTGYFKAANVFLFLIPFSTTSRGGSLSTTMIAAMIAIVGFFGYLFYLRVTYPPRYFRLMTPRHVEWAESRPPCLQSFDARIRPVSVSTLGGSEVLRAALGRRGFLLEIELTNTSNEVFRPVHGEGPFSGVGSTNVSYQWLDADGTVVLDGERAVIRRALGPNESTIVRLGVAVPDGDGDLTLRVSPVQDGCAWFHWQNHAAAYDTTVRLR